jgi:hypothetical protein
MLSTFKEIKADIFSANQYPIEKNGYWTRKAKSGRTIITKQQQQTITVVRDSNAI